VHVTKETQTLFHKNETGLETGHVCAVGPDDQFPQGQWGQHMVVSLPLVNTVKQVICHSLPTVHNTDLCILEGLMLPNKCTLD